MRRTGCERGAPWRLWLAGLGLVLLLFAPLGCGDEVTGSSGTQAGAKCGSATCAANEYCCDAACGLCVAAEVACTETCE